MTTNPAAADHLADLDARYDAHAEALRRHAEQMRSALDAGADALAGRLQRPPDPQPQR